MVPLMWKPWRVLVVAAAAVLVLTTPAYAATEKQPIKGTLRLHSEPEAIVAIRDSDDAGSPCAGWSQAGYGDLDEGAQVVVENAKGAVVGVGRLSPGRSANVTAVGNGKSSDCFFTFTVKVPDSPSYGVTIGDRGTYTAKRRVLQKNGWKLALQIP